MTETIKLPKNKAQIHPNPYPTVACDIFNCRNRAAWFIGRPDGPLNLCLNVCDDCLQDILASVPKQEQEEKQDEQTYPCPHCDEVLSSRQGLAGHIRWKHKEGK